VDVPSFHVAAGDEISVKAKSKDILPVEASLSARTRPSLLEWLALDEKARVGRMVRQPTRADIPLAAQEQLIVELYSK
jgi:small subunit ribosomal protein S4